MVWTPDRQEYVGHSSFTPRDEADTHYNLLLIQQSTTVNNSWPDSPVIDEIRLKNKWGKSSSLRGYRFTNAGKGTTGYLIPNDRKEENKQRFKLSRFLSCWSHKSINNVIIVWNSLIGCLHWYAERKENNVCTKFPEDFQIAELMDSQWFLQYFIGFYVDSFIGYWSV